MDESRDYSFARYLCPNKSVDDRALNRHVWHSLENALPLVEPGSPLRIFEVGSGIGTMLERMMDWNLLRYAEYLGLDSIPDNINFAMQRINNWAIAQGFQMSLDAANNFTLKRDDKQLTVRFLTADLFEYIANWGSQERWDLLVAHAFLDLMDIPRTLPLLFKLLKPNGIFYFSINYDGITLLEPILD